jgi:hypothetical protein
VTAYQKAAEAHRIAAIMRIKNALDLGVDVVV